ncbi:MAG: hypothetical protein PHT33_10210 [bacterium]|nr:hypothetical protein [bacterium]
MCLINRKTNAEDINIKLSRYESMIGLWQHHDKILLNWLPTVIAVIVVLGSFFNRGLLLSQNAKGLVLSSLGIVTLCIAYAMLRVRVVRENIRKAIDDIEGELGIKKAKLSDLQHPIGFPGTVLLTWLTWIIGISLLIIGLYNSAMNLDKDTLALLFVVIITLLVMLVFYLMPFFDNHKEKR